MEVSELKASFDAFTEGQLTFEALCEALERAATTSPEDAEELSALIEQQRSRGLLDEAQRRALLARLGKRSHVPAPAHQSRDQTAIPSGAARAATASAAEGFDPDSTVVLPGGTQGRAQRAGPVEESTQPTDLEAQGATVAGSADEIDESAPERAREPPDARAGAPDETRVIAPTPAGETDKTLVLPAGAATGPAREAAAKEIGPGHVLKGRFRLISELGKGGMGAVWKAVDMLKAEAKDKDPYVAIKLLRGDFKDHPEAFIALQRETAKQQRLAHPNIATVYDFDRDGDTIYMTMQVLEGQPLDKYIKALDEDGLPYEEALPIVEQLAAGLAYAHSHNLVHSDLKPGNAYFTKDKIVKLLDFGIARASATKADAGGETTVFDPGELGALTPTYATVEMFAGKDPDPRDDIYALAIMAYQLLTGKHPYGKKPAPKAAELRLTPEPVAKLNKRQNRALARGLAFLRQDRSPTVEEFMEGIRRKKSYLPYYVGFGVLLTALIGGVAYKPVVDWVDKREREQVIALMEPGNFEAIQRGLELASQLEKPSQREAIFTDQRVVERLVEWTESADTESIARGIATLRQFPGGLFDAVAGHPRTAQAIVDRIEAGTETDIMQGLELAIEFRDRGLLLSVLQDPASIRAMVDFIRPDPEAAVDEARLETGLDMLNPNAGRWGALSLEPWQGSILEEWQRKVLSDERTTTAMAELMSAGGEAGIERGLELMGPFPGWQERVMDRSDVRNAIVDLYIHGRIETQFWVPEQKIYDYENASAVIRELLDIYPDSAQVNAAVQRFNLSVEEEIARLVARFESLLAAGQILPEDEGDFAGLLRTIVSAATQAEHEAMTLNRDPRIPERYAALAEEAFEAEDYPRAREIVAEGLRFDPPSERLLALGKAADAELQRLADEKLVAEIEGRLARQWPSFASIGDFRAVYEDIATLARLSPRSPLLADIQGALAAKFEAELARLTAAAEFAPAEALMRELGPFLTVTALAEARARLTQKGDAAAYALARDPEAVSAARTEIGRLLESPAFNAEWDARVANAYKALVVLLPAGDPVAQAERDRVANVYLARARSARDAEQFEPAREALAKALAFYPDFPAREAEEGAIARAEEAMRQRIAEEQRQARIAELKAQLLARAGEDAPGEAQALLAELRGELPADDPFLRDQAPSAIGQAYLRLAERSDEIERSVKLVREGLEVAPNATELESALETYSEALEAHALALQVRPAPLEVQPPLAPGDGLRLAELPGRRSALGVLDTSQPLARGEIAFRPDSLPLARAAGADPGRYPALRPAYADRAAEAILASLDDAAMAADEIEGPLELFGALYPDRAEALRARAAGVLAERVAGRGVGTANSVAALAGPLAEYAQVFPDHGAALRDRMARAVRERLAALDADKSKLHEYNDVLAAAKQTFSGSALFSGLRAKIPPTDSKLIASVGYQALEAGRLSDALEVLKQVNEEQPDALNLESFHQDLKTRAGEAIAYYEKFEDFKDRNQPSRGKAFLERAREIWTDNPEYDREWQAVQGIKDTVKQGECSPKLAGLGADRRATCYDRIADKYKGPVMVVVPTGRGVESPYAIGKYEVSVEDFNRYCKLSGECDSIRDGSRRSPVTQVTVEQARGYAAWLSTEASASSDEQIVYRLPTDVEWEHAAASGGAQPKKDFNCRVMLGDQTIKGHSLVDVRSGVENEWGLANYIGNAQEWAVVGSSLVARGGAYEDPLSECDISAKRAHNGRADHVTGFRLVREMN